MRVRDLRGCGGHLVELAWELNELGVDSVVRLSPDGPASMEIFLPAGRRGSASGKRGRDSVVAGERRRERDARIGAGEAREQDVWIGAGEARERGERVAGVTQ
ncbi:hypothetical protein ACIBCT_10860 [Streptosporangium sp. NPDC050855]|uniref:hypothetical protein n=1 Tax=Streptosporangium sp. NPDC050855 TaxID=3366194 RepID=UPI0037BB4F60